MKDIQIDPEAIAEIELLSEGRKIKFTAPLRVLFPGFFIHIHNKLGSTEDILLHQPLSDQSMVTFSIPPGASVTKKIE